MRSGAIVATAVALTASWSPLVVPQPRELVLPVSSIPKGFGQAFSKPMSITEVGGIPSVVAKLRGWGFAGAWISAYGSQGRSRAVVGLISIGESFRTSNGAHFAFAEIAKHRRTLPIRFGDEGLLTGHRPGHFGGRTVEKVVLIWRRRNVIASLEVDAFRGMRLATQTALRRFSSIQDTRIRHALQR